jgi:hypothetical protein
MIFFDCKAQLCYSHRERLPLHCIFNEYIVQKLKANNIKKIGRNYYSSSISAKGSSEHLGMSPKREA